MEHWWHRHRTPRHCHLIVTFLPRRRQHLADLKSHSWMPNLPPFLAHQVVLYLTRSQSLPANPRHYRPSVARPWLSSSSAISPTWEPSQALPKVFLFPIEPTPSQPSSYPVGRQSRKRRHLARSSESCQPPSISVVARLQATKHYHRPCVLLPMVTAGPC